MITVFHNVVSVTREMGFEGVAMLYHFHCTVLLGIVGGPALLVFSLCLLDQCLFSHCEVVQLFRNNKVALHILNPVFLFL